MITKLLCIVIVPMALSVHVSYVSGNFMTDTRPLAPFTSLQTHHAIRAWVSTGGIFSVSITARSSVLRYIRNEIDDTGILSLMLHPGVYRDSGLGEINASIVVAWPLVDISTHDASSVMADVARGSLTASDASMIGVGHLNSASAVGFVAPREAAAKIDDDFNASSTTVASSSRACIHIEDLASADKTVDITTSESSCVIVHKGVAPNFTVSASSSSQVTLDNLTGLLTTLTTTNQSSIAVGTLTAFDKADIITSDYGNISVQRGESPRSHVYASSSSHVDLGDFKVSSTEITCEDGAHVIGQSSQHAKIEAANSAVVDTHVSGNASVTCSSSGSIFITGTSQVEKNMIGSCQVTVSSITVVS